MQPDQHALTNFLDYIATDIHLGSIDLAGPCTCRWFGADVQAAVLWAEAENRFGKNVYWTPNQVRQGLNSKPRKADVVSTRFLYVDIDPPKDGSGLDKIKTCAELAAHEGPPSFVIDSGGGLQAFWRVAGPITSDEAEDLNRNMADRFGGDRCHNVDRLMRLPGTVNFPNKKKASLGRVPTMAKVIYDADGVLC